MASDENRQSLRFYTQTCQLHLPLYLSPCLLHHCNCLIWHLIIGLWPSLQGHPRQTNLHWWGTTPGARYHHPKETDPRAKTPAHPTTARQPETGEDVGQRSNHCSDFLPPPPPDVLWEGDTEDLCQAWYGGQLILWGPVHGGEVVCQFCICGNSCVAGRSIW